MYRRPDASETDVLMPVDIKMVTSHVDAHHASIPTGVSAPQLTNVETGVVSASPRPREALYDIVDCDVVIDHALLYSLGALDLGCQQLEDPD